jgi:hypothetical protein
MLLVDPMKQQALMHDGGKMNELWHKHLGHFHYGALPLLKDMLWGLSDIKIEKTGSVQGMCTPETFENYVPSNKS